MVNFFLDLLSSAHENKYLEQIREEAQSIFQSEADWMNHTSVTKLHLTDSAIRESMRRNSINSRGLLREVLPKDGVTLPDGNFLPRGAWVGMAERSVHLDENFYPNAHQYEPFRFDRRQQRERTMSTEVSKNSEGDEKSLSLPSTSDVFMAWGHGRHAW